ncbi:MAG: hypothetical protein COX57_04010 [Alphaproteobacteria bacterium CG_4_10_14_0_2_um_filter_63_37]|nr:MAG: hypothetical protein AUJ55_08120 [Proteobacteria bacterium CG1_02_64_396]PJA25315.1 MAG: hypothetical protein COX57_04010 [Alphaproteobacteria bacterium CG_4_10_14_0_2_um_filter_63_37]
MPKLLMTLNGALEREISLEGGPVRFGRKADNDVVLDNQVVSGHHAQVLKLGDVWIVEDLGSLNGTYLNRKKIEKAALKHGDQLIVGQHVFVFAEKDIALKPSDEDESENDLDKTMLLDTRKPAKGASPNATMSGIGPAEPKTAVLAIISGAMSGKEVKLSRRVTVLGKSENAHILVKGFFVGKQAAVITQRGNEYYLAHNEGTVHPKINGETLKENHQQLLKDGDRIELGDTTMEFLQQ